MSWARGNKSEREMDAYRFHIWRLRLSVSDICEYRRTFQVRTIEQDHSTQLFTNIMIYRGSVNKLG
jgi:hypothetical protein